MFCVLVFGSSVPGFARTLYSAFTYTLIAGAVGALITEVRAAMEANEQVDPSLRAQDRGSRVEMLGRCGESWLIMLNPCLLIFRGF